MKFGIKDINSLEEIAIGLRTIGIKKLRLDKKLRILEIEVFERSKK